MEGLRTPSVLSSIHIPASISKTPFTSHKFLNFQFNPLPTSTFSRKTQSKSKLFTAMPSSPSFVSTPEPELEADSQADKFDWYAHWYPVMPVCDLDKRAPHAKRWWDLILWCGGTRMRVHGEYSTMLALTEWLRCLKEGSIDGEGYSVCTMVGVLMAPVTATSFLKHHLMVLR